MKLICLVEHEAFLKEKLSPFEDLNITLVENGMKYEGISYQFDIENIEILMNYLTELKQKQTLFGIKNEGIYPIALNKIIYIEGLSRECFFYTENDIYESEYRLYELEEILKETSFVRINKSTLINLLHIDYLLPEPNMKYGVYMKNRIKLTLSRKYLKEFKSKLKKR